MYKVIAMDLKDRLRQLRKEYGYTQEEAAKLIGVSKFSINAWEHGKSSPSVYQANRIYEVYNRPKDSIIF